MRNTGFKDQTVQPYTNKFEPPLVMLEPEEYEEASAAAQRSVQAAASVATTTSIGFSLFLGVTMFFLFSNNHLNDIIGLGFDLRDEEVLAHFITLLKTISFKLDRDTIQFFFQVDANNRCALRTETFLQPLCLHPCPSAMHGVPWRLDCISGV